MAYRKKCEKCGDTFYNPYPAVKYCPKCEFEEFKKENEDKEFDTFSSDFVICPHCGNYFEPDTCDDRELFEYDGENILECNECHEEFIVENHVSYSWVTRKMED